MSKHSTKIAEKVSAVSSKPEYSGLCVNCVNANTCTYPRELNRPVLQCEEFDCYEIPVEKTTVDRILAIASSQVSSGIEESVGLKGLCVNCENRKTCTFPKPAAGVWHCEEYA
jgi:hypothetical protein